MRFILTIVGCCFLVVAQAQSQRNFREEARSLKKLLTEQHYHPRTIDNTFSEQVFDEMMDALDPDRMYFIEEDIRAVSKYRTLLDDELNGKSWDFLSAITPLYRKSLERAQQSIQKATAIPFKAISAETFALDTVWAARELTLQIRWRKLMNYQTLDRLADLKKKSGIDPTFFTTHEADARNHAKAAQLRTIERILHDASGFETYMATQLLESITAVYDPHTNYYNIANMQAFLASMSAEGFYFGITLKENERGNVAISSLSPGSPAWKSGVLGIQDELVSLRWENQETIDMSGVTLDEANDILEDGGQELMEFTVKKSSGEVKSVKLRKEKLSMEENFVRSYVLNGANGKRFGYITLPDFYTEWGDETDGSRCANDVAKEVLKLLKENIQGLILDVRYNGGGSLKEAIALAGIFIEEGALGMMQTRSEPPVILKDTNRGTIYDGPMILLVNGQSASASEFLAASLQDYHRAIIVGNRTFGKATGQQVLPLESEKKPPVTNENFGFAKITTSRIYRVTGKSAQGKGVVPDIYLPDVFEALNYHESGRPYCLVADSIDKKSYYRPLPSLPVSVLQKQSADRIANGKSFSSIAKTTQWLLAQAAKENDGVMLSWDNFSRMADDERKLYEEIDAAVGMPNNHFKAGNSAIDIHRFDVDPQAKSFNDAWIERLQKDIYLDEAFLIMSDWTDLNKKH